MAAKTFTITEAGITAGQQIDALTSVVLVRGNLNGGLLFIEASNADSNYAEATSTINGNLSAGGIYSMQLPEGWYVRCRVVQGTAAPAITVVVE